MMFGIDRRSIQNFDWVLLGNVLWYGPRFSEVICLRADIGDAPAFGIRRRRSGAVFQYDSLWACFWSKAGGGVRWIRPPVREKDSVMLRRGFPRCLPPYRVGP